MQQNYYHHHQQQQQPTPQQQHQHPSMEAQLNQLHKQSIATAIQYICTHAETYYEAVRRAAHLAGSRPESFLLRAVFALDLTRIAVPRGGAIPLSSLPNAATEAPRLRRAVPQLFSGLEPSFQETLQRLVATIDVHRQFVCWVTVEGEGMATHDIGRSIHAGVVVDALDHRPTWVGHLGGRMGSAGDNTVPPNQFMSTPDGRFVPNVNAAARQQQQQQQQQQQYYQQQPQHQNFNSPPHHHHQQQQQYQDPSHNQMMMMSPNNSNNSNNPLQTMTPQQQRDQYQNVLSSIRSSNNNEASKSFMMSPNSTNAAGGGGGGASSSSQYFAAAGDNNHQPQLLNQNPLLSTSTGSAQKPPLSSSRNNNTSSNSNNTKPPQIPDVLNLDHLDKIDEYLNVSHMCTKASTKCLEHIQSFNLRLDELHNYTSSLSDKFDDSRNVAKDLDAAVQLLMQKLQGAERQMLLLESPKPITQVELKKKEDEEKAREEKRIREKAIEEAERMLKDMKSRGVEIGIQTDPPPVIEEEEEKPKLLKKNTSSGDVFSKLQECPYCDEPGSRFCKSSGRRHETPEEKAERRWKHLFRQMSLMSSFVSTARLSKANTCVSDGGIELVL